MQYGSASSLLARVLRSRRRDVKTRQFVTIAIIAGLWTAALGLLFPTNSIPDQLSRVAVAAALLWTMGATSYRVSVNRLLHGDLFDVRGERQADLFSLTKLWSEYSRHRSGLRDGLQLLLVFLLARQVPGVWVAFSGPCAVAFFIFWRAVKRVPPGVLVVGGSSEPFSAEIHGLREALHPLRIMALLDVIDEESPFYWDRFDNFRTTNTWQQVFLILLDAAPIIVLDGRVSTTNLLYEAERVAQTAGKHVLVITNDDGVAWQQNLGSDARSFYMEKAVHVHPTAVAREVCRLAQLVMESTEDETKTR